MTRRPIIIEWGGPLSLDEVAALSSDEDYGLYQVYGRHAVFGGGALLYVGRAIDQSFAQRFAQHKSWLQHEHGIAIHVGRLSRDSYLDQPAGDAWPDWRAKVADAEGFTIWWHSPPYNSSNIASFRYSHDEHREHGIEVIHHGQRGALVDHQVWPAAELRARPAGDV